MTSLRGFSFDYDAHTNTAISSINQSSTLQQQSRTLDSLFMSPIPCSNPCYREIRSRALNDIIFYLLLVALFLYTSNSSTRSKIGRSESMEAIKSGLGLAPENAQEGTEPVAGEQGKGTTAEPFDKGNALGGLDRSYTYHEKVRWDCAI